MTRLGFERVSSRDGRTSVYHLTLSPKLLASRLNKADSTLSPVAVAHVHRAWRQHQLAQPAVPQLPLLMQSPRGISKAQWLLPLPQRPAPPVPPQLPLLLKGGSLHDHVCRLASASVVGSTAAAHPKRSILSPRYALFNRSVA